MLTIPKYRDRPMLSTVQTVHGPLNIDGLRTRLLNGLAVQAVYEPGDATRYDLVLTPIRGGFHTSAQRGLVIVRLVSGHVISMAELWDWESGASNFQIKQAATILANGNAWSIELFTWWIAALCGEA